ncbi:unnamed protein product [Protopolystoma xenopodis]|uniref:Uncharacterized protein n=1 Tax=Protopolystoma xenopodis TaxID=117903 RepID=A0A448XMR2_9PLAT|nr:unnamed protein product [Protopolystoma xenopodis]
METQSRVLHSCHFQHCNWLRHHDGTEYRPVSFLLPTFWILRLAGSVGVLMLFPCALGGTGDFLLDGGKLAGQAVANQSLCSSTCPTERIISRPPVASVKSPTGTSDPPA